jgi:hypothetical protein
MKLPTGLLFETNVAELHHLNAAPVPKRFQLLTSSIQVKLWGRNRRRSHIEILKALMQLSNIAANLHLSKTDFHKQG